MRGRMPGSVKAAVLLASVTLALLTGFEVSREAYFISRILVHAEGLEGASVVLTASAANIVFQLTCGLLIALLVFAVGRGKSWARWSYIVLAVFALLSDLFGAATKGVAATGWLALGDVAVDVLIVALLFARAARAWFAADRTQENKWRGRWVCMTWWGLFVLVALTFGVVLAAAVAISEQACAKQPRLRAAIAKAQADVAATVFGSVRQAVPDIAAERRRQFDAMMREWTDNVCTNTAVETAASFRDDVVVPFVRREMPNPFSPGGAEADREWAAEASAVYEAGLRFICDSKWWIGLVDERICSRANALAKRGCEEPFILLWSALADDMDWHRTTKNSGPRLAKALEIAKSRKGTEFLQLVICYYRWLSRNGSSGEDIKKALRAWLASKTFGKEDEVALYSVCNTFAFGHDHGWFDGIGDMKWAATLDAANAAVADARETTTCGVASRVTRRGWRTLHEMHDSVRSLLDKAEKIAPGRAETLRTGLWAEGESRGGRRARFDELFRSLATRRLDDDGSLNFYIWYRLYPRWGQTRGYDEMLRFAEACYETGRHDTQLPYFYAEIQCRYVRDSNTDPYKYFRDNPEIAERCIDVCMRQVTNEYACGYVRTHAPFVGEAVAFYAGRYEDAARMSAPNYLCDRYNFSTIFNDLDQDEINAKAEAFEGSQSNVCIRLQRMLDDGRYEDVRDEIGRLRKTAAFKNTDSCYWEYRLSELLSLDVAMETDFKDGKSVAARIPSYLHGWSGYGWWRCSDSTMQTYQAFSWEHGMTWLAKLPKAHELEFDLEPKPKTSGRHVLVVSRAVREESHHRPLNGLPFVTLIWEKDRIGAYLSCDYYSIIDVDDSRASWADAKEAKRKVRIVCDGESVGVYVGDATEPLCKSLRFAEAIKESPERGMATFRGENVRISNIAVRRNPENGKTQR